MKINFPNGCAEDQDCSGDILFHAVVDCKQIQCLIRKEALQDINPKGRLDSSIIQFETNKLKIIEIAERKIRAGNLQKGKVIISNKDL
jgi:hypothetical protein